MLKLWIFLTFLCVGIRAFESNEGSEYYDDYGDVAAAENEENANWFNLFKSEEGDLNKDVSGLEQFADAISDYQIEDNRSIGKDDKHNSDKYEDDIHDITNTENLDVDDQSASNEDQDILNNKNSQEIIQQILDDTKSILSEETGNDFAEDTPVKDEANKNITAQYKDLIDEAKRLIEETHDALDEDTSILSNEDTETRKVAQNNVNELNGLIHDIVELNEVGNKLDIPSSVSDDFSDTIHEIFPSEEDYEELDDSNLERLFDKNDVSAQEIEDAAEMHQVEPFPDDSDIVELIEKDSILYHNDDLIPNEFETTQASESTTPLTEATQLSSELTESGSEFARETKNSENVTDTRNMTDSQVDILLTDFSQKNLNDIVSNAKATNNPQRVWLSVDKPTVITSPGYPNPYATNTITDWIFEGVGTGIEFNVTDCAINGHIGDYLLVKPGSIDDSGHEGLIFTYTLNTERWYRFLDVDRMFMRFEAKTGMSFMRGFSVSARMIVPAPVINDPEPDALPPVTAPEHSLTLNLGGISLEGFLTVEEQFRQIVADMATMYINANGINPGLNSTLDVTQITSTALCFHNWPKFENCAEVRFAVPLVLEEGERPRLDEEDLHNMWLEYSTQDPFAVRLRMLGITEFQVPNDRGVLVVWLVIAAGVVISMAMLALALWRFSCIENYTRMPTFSDTDSLNEKRKLDMFPTPHQTLPPLFTEADYKWADSEEQCKVDVGAFSNKNFLQDDMLDIDSDEDIVPGRNRDAGISPRDLYSV